MNDETPKRGRGRPKKEKTPEEIQAAIERRREIQKKYTRSPKGIARNKKYRESLKLTKGDQFYDLKVRLSAEHKSEIKALSEKTGLSINALVIEALEKTYNINLRK